MRQTFHSTKISRHSVRVVSQVRVSSVIDFHANPHVSKEGAVFITV